jgi:hypothetical protein
MKKHILLLIITFIYTTGISISQNQVNSDQYENYGFFSNYAYQIHNSNFQRLPGIPNCCPEFTEGYSKGFSIGGVYQYLFPFYGFEFRAGLNFFKGNFTASENTVFSVDDTPSNGKIDHIIDFDLKSLSIDGSFKYNIDSRINISFGLGVSFFYNYSFNQFEKISSPEGKIYFLDSNGKNTFKSTRNEKTGDIPNLNIVQAFTMAKIGYDLDLKKDKSLILRPEIGFNYYFLNMIKDLEWQTMSFRFGISILFSTQKFMKSEFESNNELSIEQQLVQLKSENEELKQQIQNIISNQKTLQESLKKEQVEKDTIAKTLNEKENLLEKIQDSSLNEQKRIADEREQFNKMIDAENKKTGRMCNCFVILFTTTTDKKEADKLFHILQNNEIKNINIVTFIEPYLKDKYYRVQSECYTNPLEAFDDKQKFQSKTNLLNIVPQILCNK